MIRPISKWFERGTHALLTAILILLPFAFGGTQAWSQEIFFGLDAMIVLCVLSRTTIDTTSSLQWNPAYAVILLFLLLTIAQLVAWPTGIIALFSPHTAALRSSLLGAPLSHQTLSLYPQATTENLRLIFAVVGIFFAVTQLYQTPRQIENLLLTIALVGFAVSLLAVYQNATGATTVYGMVTAPHRNSGPFMNYSHFSQFMNLSIASSAGLVLVRSMSVMAADRSSIHSFEDFIQLLNHPRMRIVNLLLVAIVIEGITIVLSLSRMGTVSLIAAAAMTGAVFTWRTRSKDKGSILLTLGIIGFAILLCVGFDAIYARLATLRHIQTTDGGRWQMLRDMCGAIKQFPLTGTGLGTHEYVFPMFDRSAIREVATHSENEFAQLLEETGAPGLFLSFAFLTFIGRCVWSAIRTPQQPIQYAAFGLGFGLLAILLHSCTDFGQHVPANAVLTACTTGLLVNLARLAQPAVHATVSRLDVRRRMITRGTLTCAATLAALWCVTGAQAARAADDACDAALIASKPLQDHQWQGTDDQYIALLTPATLATTLQPQNVKFRYWLNVFRWRSLARLETTNGKGFAIPQLVVPFVTKIVADLNEAMFLCPTYAGNYSLAGELEHFILHNSAGKNHIAIAFVLNHKDANVDFVTGELALEEYRWNEAVNAFTDAAAVGGDKREAIGLCVNQANRPDLAYQLAKDDVLVLRSLVDQLVSRPHYADLLAKCRSRIVSLLEYQADQPDASAETIALLADQYSDLGQQAKAITSYRKAIALDYAQVAWHYRLANLLAESGDQQGGMVEARICVRLRPQMKEAATLLSSLSVQSAAHSGKD